MASSHTYTHTQTVPSANWTIAHGLGARPLVSVQVTEQGTVQAILPLAVEYPDDQNVIIRFTSARSGTARLV